MKLFGWLTIALHVGKGDAFGEGYLHVEIHSTEVRDRTHMKTDFNCTFDTVDDVTFSSFRYDWTGSVKL